MNDSAIIIIIIIIMYTSSEQFLFTLSDTSF